jgi:hypothetical protein
MTGTILIGINLGMSGWGVSFLSGTHLWLSAKDKKKDTVSKENFVNCFGGRRTQMVSDID